jgi:DNA repair exonuclease SbcCD ATPase subunit
MSNLLDKLGMGKKKDNEPVVPANSDNAALDDVKTKVTQQSDLTAAAMKTGTEGEPTDADKPAEGGDDDPMKDWTKEQLAEALKETRQEAAKRRVEAKDMEERLQTEYEEKIKSIEEKFSPLIKKADRLEKLEQEEADKKRTLEDKVAHREQLVAQRDEELASLREELQNGRLEAEKRVAQLKADLDVHESYYKDQLDKAKAEVPKKYQDIVDTIIKGANDTKHALDLVRSAQKENLFGDKKVFVNHSVPTAKTGARTDSATAQQERRDGMKSSEKIRAGLKNALPNKPDKSNFGI